MKSHFLTIILLLTATIAFGFRFAVDGWMLSLCDTLAFAMPTLAAIIEIVHSGRTSKKMNVEIQKRAVCEHLSQEEYERRKAEGTLDENTYYATTEEE